MYESNVNQELTSHALGDLAGSPQEALSGRRMRNDVTAAILNVLLPTTNPNSLIHAYFLFEEQSTKFHPNPI